MTVFQQAKEVQTLTASFLFGEDFQEFTSIDDWTLKQSELTKGIDRLTWLAGESPDEEAERLLAILMGYSVAVRNQRNVARAMKQVEVVYPMISDEVLKCHLAVFCYMLCMDSRYGAEAHRLIEEQKLAGRSEEVLVVERLLRNMEE